MAAAGAAGAGVAGQVAGGGADADAEADGSESVSSDEEVVRASPPEADVLLDGGLRVPRGVYKRLFEYQRECVGWMWGLMRQNAGGILGDEMGLGKTVEVAAFIGALKHSRMLRPSLVVCPATMLHHWAREFHKWYPPLRVMTLHASGAAIGGEGWTRERVVSSTFSRGDILLTTYEALREHAAILVPRQWGHVILDEGHRIRNPEAQVSAVAKQLRTAHRFVLTGAPIQNNLRELWSLFDFVFPGKLGSLPVFEAQFAAPIRAGGWAHASKMATHIAYRCAVVLRSLVAPHLLRRLKRDVHAHLPAKSELILFCRLTDAQRDVYRRLLGSEEVRAVLARETSAFRAIIQLRKVCNHPDLLAPADARPPDAGAPERSGKMLVLLQALRMWRGQRHRVLLFSQGTQMLDIIEAAVRGEGYAYLRMDGGTGVSARQALVDRFNHDEGVFVFLLTTRVGGIGLNLVGADRVVLFDPDWNPSTDLQARERAWRLGQTRDVTIYRLIVSGTIEEKMYHRQIFKTVLTNRVLTDPLQKRLFNARDLADLFSYTDDVAGGGTETGDLMAVGDVTHADAAAVVRATEGGGGGGGAESDEDGDGAGGGGDGGGDGARSVPRENALVLSRLFDGGLAGAFSHDVVESASARGDSTGVYMQAEAQRVAERSLAALRASASEAAAAAAATAGSGAGAAARRGTRARAPTGPAAAAAAAAAAAGGGAEVPPARRVSRSTVLAASVTRGRGAARSSLDDDPEVPHERDEAPPVVGGVRIVVSGRASASKAPASWILLERMRRLSLNLALAEQAGL